MTHLYQWYRGFIQGKTRIVTAWIFAACLLFFARQYPTWPGIVLSFLGATIRFWASGFLRKDSKLSVGGPYRYTRNPLYLGTYLMAVGTLLSIENYPLLIVMSVIFGAVYHYIILDEETKLKGIFGKPYELFLERVPRFFPSLTPARDLAEINSDPEHQKFSWEVAIQKNKAQEAYLSWVGLAALTFGIAYVWQRWL